MDSHRAADWQFKARLPLDLKDWIVREASRNRSTLSSEIVRSVRERMERNKSSDGVTEPRKLDTAAAESRPALERPSDATREERTL